MGLGAQMGQEPARGTRLQAHHTQNQSFPSPTLQILFSGSLGVREKEAESYRHWGKGGKGRHGSLKVEKSSQLEAENMKKTMFM